MCGGPQRAAMHNYVNDRNKPAAERKYESRNDVDGIDLEKMGRSYTPWDVDSISATPSTEDAAAGGAARVQTEKTASRLGNSSRGARTADRNLLAGTLTTENTRKKTLLGG